MRPRCWGRCSGSVRRPKNQRSRRSMPELVRTMPWPEPGATTSDALLTREWLVTNGLGGYASGTVGGVITRRFHGYLVAALPSPLGRTMMLNDLVEQIALPDGKTVQLGGEERSNSP